MVFQNSKHLDNDVIKGSRVLKGDLKETRHFKKDLRWI